MGEKIQERVRHGPERSFISFLAARVERWNLGVAQSKNIWHSNGNCREDDRRGAALNSFQTFTLDLGETVVSNH